MKLLLNTTVVATGHEIPKSRHHNHEGQRHLQTIYEGAVLPDSLVCWHRKGDANNGNMACGFNEGDYIPAVVKQVFCTVCSDCLSRKSEVLTFKSFASAYLPASCKYVPRSQLRLLAPFGCAEFRNRCMALLTAHRLVFSRWMRRRGSKDLSRNSCKMPAAGRA